MAIRTGVHPKTAQTLARHSDINLTMNTYTHLGLADMVSAIASLPTPPKVDEEGNQKEAQELRATGTDNATPDMPAVIPLPPACQGFGTSVHCSAQSHTPTVGKRGEDRGAE